MQKPYKETAVANIPKAELAYFNGDGLGYTDFIIKQLSAQLAERIMTVLLHEGEIVASLSDLRVEEYRPTNSVEYRRQINWSPLVRCKDCKYYNRQHHYCEGIGNWFGYEGEWSDNGFCYKGERREDEGICDI